MGRTLLAEERLQKYVEAFFTKDQWAIGLIVGQLTNQKDYAVHMVRTPPEEPEPAFQEETASESTAKKPKRRVLSLDMIDEEWVAFHAKQVLRMLPGGLDVIGIYALAPPAMMQTASASKLRQTLFAVHKMLTKEEAMLSIKTHHHTERYMLQICSVTRKLTCRTFDIADTKCAARPAEWKYQGFVSRWLSMQTSLSLDILVPVPTADISHSLMQQIQKGIQPFNRSLEEAIVMYDDHILPDDQPLDSSQQSGKKSRQSKGTSEETHTYNVALMTNMVTNNNTTNPTITECCAKLLIRGKIEGRAFVNNKATVQEATHAVKKDVIRSLFSRCELVCEDLLSSEEEQDPRVLYETPVRVFGLIEGTPLCLCDYMFPDEKVEDTLERFHDVTDLHISEEQLQIDIEKLPEEADLIRPDTVPSEPESEGNMTSSIKAFLGLAVGGAVAAAGLAAGISFMYLGQD